MRSEVVDGMMTKIPLMPLDLGSPHARPAPMAAPSRRGAISERTGRACRIPRGVGQALDHGRRSAGSGLEVHHLLSDGIDRVCVGRYYCGDYAIHRGDRLAGLVRVTAVVVAMAVGAIGGFLLAFPVTLLLAWVLTVTGAVDPGPDDEGGNLLVMLFLVFLVTVPAGAIVTGRWAWRRLARADV